MTNILLMIIILKEVINIMNFKMKRMSTVNRIIKNRLHRVRTLSRIFNLKILWIIKDLILGISSDGSIITTFIIVENFQQLITLYSTWYFAHLHGFIIENSACCKCLFYLFGHITIQIRYYNKLLLKILKDLI